MQLKVRTTGSEDYGRYVKALICGEPGAGKTLISSTFPDPFYASAEGGLMSIADRNIPYVDVKSSDDLKSVMNVLLQEPAVREKMIGRPIQTIVVDTIDEVQKIFALERQKAQKKSKMDWEDWAWLKDQMEGLVRGLRNLPLHVVFTCHLKESSDNESGRVWYVPALQGALQKSIPGYVDLSFHLKTTLDNEVVDGKLQQVQHRYLVSTPSSRYDFLKDRSGKLPGELPVNFVDDFERINQLIFGNINIPEGKFMNVDVSEPAVEEQVEKLSETKPSPVRGVSKDAKPSIVVKPLASNKDKLPEGITPIDKGYGIDVYCVECGSEVESKKRIDLSRARFQGRIYDNACYKQKLEEKKES